MVMIKDINRFKLFEQSIIGYCQQAALRMVYNYLGLYMPEEEIVELTSKAEDSCWGYTDRSLIRVSRDLGFKVQMVDGASVDLIEKLLKDNIIPITSCFEGDGHYIPVVGIERSKIILADSLYPELGPELRRINIRQFETRWYDYYGYDAYPDESNVFRRRLFIIE
ncbi:MAG: cysteine peptidase family C39 domain-containing protein [archaeon]